MDQKVRWKAKGLGFPSPAGHRRELVLPATPFVWVRGNGEQDGSGNSFEAHIPADLARPVVTALRSNKIVRFVLDHVLKEIAVESFDLAEPAEGEALVLLSFTGRFLDAEAATPETATTLGGS